MGSVAERQLLARTQLKQPYNSHVLAIDHDRAPPANSRTHKHANGCPTNVTEQHVRLMVFPLLLLRRADGVARRGAKAPDRTRLRLTCWGRERLFHTQTLAETYRSPALVKERGAPNFLQARLLRCACGTCAENRHPHARRCGGEHGSPSLTARLPTDGLSAVPNVAPELPGSPRCSEERRAKAWCDYEAGYRAWDALKAFLSRGPVMI